MAVKKIANSVFIGIILLILILIFPSQTTSFEDTNLSDKKYPSVFTLTEKDKEWIENKLNEMTVYEKCAQLIMPAVYRNDLNPESDGYDKIASLVKEQKVGGIILYQGELVEQVKFINYMQSISDIPLIIASDFERGLGTRIDDATEFPHAMALGSANNLSYAYEMGKAISIECRLMGVHWNFAPVADINNNPLNPIINIRAFSENKYEVSNFITEFIRGAKEERTLTTVKHFPGHGNTTIDSHLDLPKINGTKDSIFNNELYPFIKAIESKVHSVMIGHLDVPSLEAIKGVPATLSKSIVDHLLKKELGFDGLIITDAMIMEAITKYYSTEEAVVFAVKAGNDVILMPPDEETAITALNLAVYSGEILIDRINESVRKILSAKRWLKIEQNKYSEINNIEEKLAIEEHIKLAKDIAENSITLLKNDEELLPLILKDYKNIYCVTLTDQIGLERATYFQQILENKVENINSASFTRQSKRWEYNSLLKELKSADLIILPTFLDVKAYQGPINLAAEQTDFIAGVLHTGIPTVLISFKNPYLLYLFPESRTYLNAFSYSRVSQKAMLRAILGEIDIKGTLPITIPKSEIAFRKGLRLEKSLNTTITDITLNAETNSLINDRVNKVLAENNFPGIALCIGKNNKIIYNNASGYSGLTELSYKLGKDDVFNLRALAGFLATSQTIMMLAGEDRIDLDEPAYYYLPELNNGDKRKITIKHLLQNTAGFPKYSKNFNFTWNKEELIYNLLDEDLVNQPGTKQNYSIINQIALQKIIETITGEKLSDYIYKNLFSKIGMYNTSFHPNNNSSNFSSNIQNKSIYPSVKTESDVILDMMDGIAGFGGLFSTTYDLAKFCQMILQKGYYDDTQYLKAKTVTNWLALENEIIPKIIRKEPYTNMNKRNILISGSGFEFIDSRGSAIFIDMEKQTFLIILSNPGIDNPSNNSFVELVNDLVEFIRTEIQ